MAVVRILQKSVFVYECSEYSSISFPSTTIKRMKKMHQKKIEMHTLSQYRIYDIQKHKINLHASF